MKTGKEEGIISKITRFSFMSGMASRIATLKKLWKKEGSMLIMLRSIVGLSVIRQPLHHRC
jgi:hypothetical protein